LRIFAARTEGRDPAVEKQLARRRLVVDGVEDLVELFISEQDPVRARDLPIAAA